MLLLLQKVARLFKQLSLDFYVDSMRIATDVELSMVAVIACDEPTDTVDNSRRIGNFILRNLAQLGLAILDRSLHV